MPAIGVGMVPAGQPLAGAMLTVGISCLTGGGSVGFAPVSSAISSVARSPQALSAASATVMGSAARAERFLAEKETFESAIGLLSAGATRTIPISRLQRNSVQLDDECGLSAQRAWACQCARPRWKALPARGQARPWRTSVLVGNWSISASNFARLRPAACNTV